MRMSKRIAVVAGILGLYSLTTCGDEALQGEVTDELPEVIEDVGESENTVPVDTEPAETIVFDTALPETTTDAGEEVDVPERTCNDNPKPFFCPCDVNTQCESNYCIAVDEAEVARRCSRTCQDSCPNGWECKGIGGVGDPVFICQPPIDTLCDPCEQDSDCQAVGAKCITFEDGKYCGRDCQNAEGACPAGYTCGEILNSDGQIEAYQCVRTSGSCNCPDGTDYTSDPANCGFCGNACVFANGIPGCANEVCFLDGCDDAWKDLNEVESDGCEYRCTYQSDDDWPDASCTSENECDQNCDGIDGDYLRAVFVAPYGTPDASGAPYDPVNTINRAMELTGRGKDHIYVAAGTYNESVTLVQGISIFGGYSNDGAWVRNLTQYKTTITWSSGTSSVRTVIADGIQAGRTVLDGVEVISGTNANPGGSSYAIWIRSSSASLEIVNVTAVGGNGGGGSNGAPGVPGSNGEQGRSGDNGVEDGNCFTGIAIGCENLSSNTVGAHGGGPGANQCSMGNNAAGGAGGQAGCGDHESSAESSKSGSPSPGGAAGGAAVGIDRNGVAGSNGSNGAVGSNGSGGSAHGSVSSTGFWRGQDGQDGGPGANGVGGGGGSGGGGGDDGCDSWGGGGGGGGSGGCGGTGGRAGTAGGGSFGVFLFDASPKLIASSLASQLGGVGGRGGDGGGGGLGRPGGSGGRRNDDSGVGGAGGNGGNGGRGGHGGGGAGGVSYPLYLSGNSDPVCANLTYVKGGGGSGGASSGSVGAPGAFGERNQSSASCP